MPVRKINLGNDVDALIEERIASGQYRNADDVVRAALKALEERERETDAKVARLRAAIQVGIDQAARGEYTDVEPGDLAGHLQRLEAKAIGRRKK